MLLSMLAIQSWQVVTSDKGGKRIISKIVFYYKLFLKASFDFIC